MWQILEVKIQLMKGDITESEVDVIVNAANTDLLLGGGVAGAIRKKGGSSIQKECDKIGSVKLGGAAITEGGNLKAKYVVHAASMHLGEKTSAESLKNSLWNSLKISAEKSIETIAFPAIGTGIAGFPINKCAEIMAETFNSFILNEKHNFKEITMVLFSESDFHVFFKIFNKVYDK